MKLSLSNSGISNGLKWPYLKLLVAPTSHLPSFHGNIFLYSFLSPNLVAILDFASHDVTGGHSVGLLTWLAWVLDANLDVRYLQRMTPVSTAIVYILNFGYNIYIHKVSP